VQQNFKNKTVLITGGSRGQGAAETRMFAGAGAQVVIADVLDAEGGALAQSIRAAGGRADYRRLDVANEQDWRDAVTFATATFGSLHVLVNNAGVSLRGVDLAHTSRADWDRVLAVNLTGPFLGIKAAAPVIRDSGGGSIVNIGSTAGINGHFAAAYSASKWGLRGLTKAAAMEYADWNIRVNAVHPSIVPTPCRRRRCVRRSHGIRDGAQAQRVAGGRRPRRDVSCERRGGVPHRPRPAGRRRLHRTRRLPASVAARDRQRLTQARRRAPG
jgi:3alpha(or 20beta)-hydroxysteroid dehydrogenase